MNRSHFHILLSDMKKYPVTWFFFILIVGLYISVLSYQVNHPDEAKDAYRDLGALSTLTMMQTVPDQPELQPTDLKGHFNLWDGEYWRILISGLHHGGIFHLVCNGLSLLWLGRLIEPLMKKLPYALFILSSTYISFLPDVFLEQDVVGISGGLCAMFGLLLILRKHYNHISSVIDENVIQFMFFFLIGCVIATELGLTRIGNMAHFTGLFYGVLFGIAVWGMPVDWKFSKWNLNEWQVRLCRKAFLLSHLLLIPITYYSIHPEWNARYHWYQAYESRKERVQNNQPGISKRTLSEITLQEATELKKAVELDPGLAGAWGNLAKFYYHSDDYHQAWKSILAGLDYNRSYEEGIGIAQAVWIQFSTVESRKEAMEILVSRFDDEAGQWLHRLELLPGQRYSIERLKSRGKLAEKNHSILEFFKSPSTNSKQLPGFENRLYKLDQEDQRKERIPELPDEAEEGFLL